MGKSFRLFKIFQKKKKQDDDFLIKKDIKSIDHLLVKRHKTVKEIELIDQRITLIQKSTKTTVPQLRPLHDTLRQRYKWYYNWHLQPYAKTLHVLILLFYVFSLGFTLNYLIKPVTKIKADTTYDFPQWETENPKPTAANLSDVYVYDQNNVWAVGSAGTIINFNGTEWKDQYTGVGVDLRSISGVSPSDIWAVGENNMILKYNGIAWTVQPNSTGVSFNQVVVKSENNIWALGSNKIFHFDGNTWSIAYSDPVISGISQISVLDSGQIWASGYGQNAYKIIHFNGTTWSYENFSQFGIATIVAINDTDVIVAGSAISRFNGTTWVPQNVSVGGLVTKLYAKNENDIWVATQEDGNFYHYNGSDWETVPIGVGYATGISGSAGKIWAVGGSDVYKYDGDDWTQQREGTGESMTEMYTPSSDNVWVVGGEGILKHYNGSIWSEVQGLTSNGLGGIDGLSGNDIWAVGADSTLLRYNGSSWSVSSISSQVGLLRLGDIKVVSDTDVYVLGYVSPNGPGKLIHYNGTNWTTVISSASRGFSDLLVFSSSDIWLFGDKNNTMHYDGQDWHNVDIGICGDLTCNVSFSRVQSLSPDDFWVTGQKNQNIGNVGILLHYKNGSWTSSISPQTSADGLYVQDDQNIWVGASSSLGSHIYKYNGETWTSITTLPWPVYDIRVFSSDNILAIGSYGEIIRYHSPANATAKKLWIQLPGQSFANNTGVFDNPAVESVHVGESVSATIYATDNSNVLDKGNASTVGFTTTDPNDENPATIPLTMGNTCVQNRTDPSQSTCGQGTTNFIFHTAGDWTITTRDTNDILAAGTSSSIHVDPGPAKLLSFSDFPASLAAGAPSGAVTLQAKDLYGNNTTVTTDTVVNLKTTSSSGRFSTNRSNWSSGEMNLTIPGGSGSVTFYYLDLATGNPTITVTSNGLTTYSAQINITAGELSGSTINLSRNSIRAGESLTAQVNLKNNQGILSGKTVRLSSSREGDSTGGDQVTDGSGNASFNVSATKVGSFDLIIYNVSDDLYATASATVQVTPGDLSTAALTSNISKITAGESINLTTTLLDKFGNTLDNSNSLISFSSTDSKAEFDQSNHWFSDSGTYSQSVVLRTSGTQKVEALKSGSVLGSTTININPAPVDADVSTVSSDKDRIDPSSGVAAIVVKLTDIYGNGISGKNVSITSSRSEDKITPLSAITGDDGQTNFSFSAEVQGDSTIVAQDMTDNLVLTKKLKIRVAPANILDKIKESPLAKALTNALAPVSKALALIGLIPLILQVLQAIPSAAPLATSVFPALFTTASVRRRKKPWGNVFDSLTGHPVDLAVVRLYAKDTGKLVSTQVTDFDGRFHFLAGTGTYYIQVKRKGYEFPAKISKFKASQLSSRFGKDSDIYLGVPFTIQNKNAQINLNIPIDPVLEKLTNNIKFRKTLKESFEWFLIIISYIAFPLMLIGAAVAALTTVVVASRVNFVTDIVYFFLLSGFLVTSRIRQNRLGQVFDSETKKPISGAMVTVFDQEYNAIRQTQTTDRNGNFSILAQEGAYYIIIEKDGYKFPSTKIETNKKQSIYTGGIINKAKTGFIGVDIPMDKN